MSQFKPTGFTANRHIIVKDDCDFTGNFKITIEGENKGLVFPEKLKGRRSSSNEPHAAQPSSHLSEGKI